MRSVHKAPTEAQVRNAYKANEQLMKLLGPKAAFRKVKTVYAAMPHIGKAPTYYEMSGNGYTICHERRNGYSHVSVSHPKIVGPYSLSSGLDIHEVVASATRKYCNALSRHLAKNR